MSDSNRGAGNQALVTKPSDNGAGSEKSAKGNDGTSNQNAATVILPLKEDARPNEAAVANTQAQTEQPDPYKIRDLKAQENMAYWAGWMFWAALATFAITSIGTFLIWRQVKLTRQAVEDTSEATEAMREANAIARESHRAWLEFGAGESGTLWVKPDCLEFCTPITLHNHGNSPALEIWCDGFLSFEQPSPKEVFIELALSHPSDRDGRTIVFPNIVEGTQLEIVREGTRPDTSDLFVTIIAHYKVIGDDDVHHTAFTYTTRPVSATGVYGADGEKIRLNYGDIHHRINLSLHKGQGGLPLAT